MVHPPPLLRATPARATPSFGTSFRRARGGAIDFTALGGKVCSSGPGIEPEEREAVQVGLDPVKLLTLGAGKVDKDAVLQPAKTQIDRLQAPSQEIVFKVLHIGGSLVRRGIQSPRLGLVQEIIDQLNKLAAGLGDFGNHRFLFRRSRIARRLRS
jgi:hypothetical protein